VLALLCIALWLPGILTLPPLDRDESRFAQSSKQMLESGDFIDIRFGHVPRYKKPVAIYWLQAATTEVAGLGDKSHIWTYRLASLLGGIAAVWLAFWTARAFAAPETALLASALLGASLLLTAEATIATTDAVLLAAILGAQGALMRVYLAARDAKRVVPARLTVLLGWAALGIGVLVKGPVALAIAALTVLGLSLWDRDVKWLRGTHPLLGLPLAALIVAPWAIAIAIASHGQFYTQALGNDFAAKIAGGQESHGALPGYYLALVSLTLWPATLFLIPGIGHAVRHRAEPWVRFLVIWAGLSWVMFELVPTKLPHYVLPAYPALAMLGAAWAMSPASQQDGRMRLLAGIAAAQFALGAFAFAAAPAWLATHYGEGATALVFIFSGAGASLGVMAIVLLLRGSRPAAALAAIGAALVLYVTLTLGVAPGLDRIWVSERLAARVVHDRRSMDPPPALAGFEEPSLVFYLGTDTRLTDGTGAADVTADQGGLAIVEDSERGRFVSRLGDLGAEPFALDTVTGLNYSKGKPVRITIYRVNPAHLDTAPPAE
jgi:4-amino-4-deoxy-L-arabinose transferase-like glycosyltransferase